MSAAGLGDVGTASLEIMGSVVVGGEPFCVVVVVVMWGWPGEFGSWAE